MPDYTANPTDADLQALLTGAGVWSSAFTSLIVGYADAAVKDFEQQTGRRPYLALSSRTVTFDPPTGRAGPTDQGGIRLWLDTPFTSISAIAVDCTTSNPSGTAITIDEDVFLYPERRDLTGDAIESLVFESYFGTGRKSIGITGTPGSVDEWPPNIWNAVLAGAAANFGIDVISASIGKGLASWKEADVSEVYGELKAALGTNIELWRAQFSKAVGRNILIVGES